MATTTPTKSRDCDGCGKVTVRYRHGDGRWCGGCRPRLDSPAPGAAGDCLALCPKPGDRLDALARLYAAAEAFPTESAARRAGLPTSVSDLPWRTDLT